MAQPSYVDFETVSRRSLECGLRAYGKPKLNLEEPAHWLLDHRGQVQAWASKTRILAILAGWQSGKTDYLVEWVLRQCARRGPGDALVLAPSHPLLLVAAQPRLVKRLDAAFGIDGHHKGDNCYIVPEASLRRAGWSGKSGDLTIWFRHTQDVKAVEAATALWVAADECGQMPDEIWEAIQGRTSATGGDILLISRPYFDNWYRSLCESPGNEATIVSFASWDNPGWLGHLSKSERDAEIQRLKDSMPLWRFEMKYGGKFTRPAGAIIDNWDEKYEVPQFFVPGDWKRFTFHDFGQVHAFVIQAAEHPTEKDSEGYPVIYCYREVFPAQSTATVDLVRELMAAEQADLRAWAQITGSPVPAYRPRGIGGNATTEEGWRESYTHAGLRVEAPLVAKIEPQIDRLYACVGRGGLRITKNCEHLLRMLKKWSWEIDDGGDPIPGKILNDAAFHGPAALRYGISQLRPNRREAQPETPRFPMGSIGSQLPPVQDTPAWRG